MSVECPYCDIALKKMPSRKSKCPACGETIYVKKTPDDRTKRVMTEAQAEAAEALWEARHFDTQMLRALNDIGSTEKDLHIVLQKLPPDSSREEAFRELLLEIANHHQDNYRRKMAHLKLARILEREGGDFVRHLREAARYSLLEHQDSGVAAGVQIKTSGKENNVCPECQKQNGKIIDIETALKEMPVPCEHCTTMLGSGRKGYCRCYYEIVFDDD